MSGLEEKVRDKTAIIGIVGLGYVGLPLAIAFAQVGFKVIGFDIQERRVEAVGRGESYLSDTSSKTLSTLVASNLLEATTDQSRLIEVDTICICVPTPLSRTKEPDLTYVVHESEEVSKYLQHGQLVILESTTYPGTTREVILPVLERSGLKVGRDFYLAYSPERIDPGNKEYGIKNVPKLVGGIDSESTRLAKLIYNQVAKKVISLTAPEVGEMTKIFENVFRSVNIALVNELAWLCENMGISVWEVIAAASSKPFGYMPFYPGPGIGGHCIPLDPYYLANKAREYDFHTRFIELAAQINEQMPYYVTSRIIEVLNNEGKSLRGAKVLVLGVSYKKDIEDVRESPSLKLIQLLRKKGAELSYNDPYVAKIQIGEGTLASVELTEEYLSSMDCIVIATDHSSYDYQYIVDHVPLVFDTRGATRSVKGKNIFRLGE
ncbi:nucleotide sugar dehydrogenase [Chloroflexota bacterium]